MKNNEFVTSDLHFGHTNIIKYCNRPFKDAEEMDEAIIKKWNEKVSRDSTVYIIGDVSFHKQTRTEYILHRLHGNLCLIRGNHDQVMKGKQIEARMEWMRDYHESKTDNGIKVSMSHYPMVTWNQSHRGSWMLHGHAHGTMPKTLKRRLDVGIDTHPDYAPYSFDEVNRYMSQEKRE